MKASHINLSEHPRYADPAEAVAAFAAGEMLILVDDESRENEGDLVMAADAVTPQAINFMTRHGRGLVCIAITQQRAEQLALTPMVRNNSALLETAFTVSVDSRHRNSTGISAQDRAATIEVLLDPAAQPEDLARPGHMFPLVAKAGGVLERPGHTEAVVDLARLAGRYPAGVLCEILDEDGSMARLPRLLTLAAELDLKIAHIEDLSGYLAGRAEKSGNPMARIA
ncbi:MAG: 3,4-dihydroxy-2-butanone-4-phosphate synthase [Calditrichaeota bacterium]|nr:3,4-dihydroxy-2-butanone-4-phosphate synthase [Calditrichota bacterium]